MFEQLRALMFSLTLVLGIVEGAEALEAATAAALGQPASPLMTNDAAADKANAAKPRYPYQPCQPYGVRALWHQHQGLSTMT